MSIVYEKWVEDNRAGLAEISGKDVIIAYSGGKDSSVVLHLMDMASKEFGFTFEARGVIIPEHVLIESERNRLGEYWSKRGIEIHWHAVADADKSLAEAPKGGISPCLVCNRSKKQVLMEYFKETRPDWGNLVMVISYSLWDLVSATVEHLTTGVFADAELSEAVQAKTPEDRFIEIAQRFYPLLKLGSGLTVFKPLIFYNDQDILETVEQNSLPITAPACTYKEYRPKRGFAAYYHNRDLHFNYRQVFEFARNVLKIPDQEYYSDMTIEDYTKKVL